MISKIWDGIMCFEINIVIEVTYFMGFSQIKGTSKKISDSVAWLHDAENNFLKHLSTPYLNI